MEKLIPDVKTETVSRLLFTRKIQPNKTVDPSMMRTFWLQELKLLEYLFNYKRTVDPSEYEKNYQPISEEKEMLCGRRILSEASQYRLPFHPLLLGDPWKIICKCFSFRRKQTRYCILYILLCEYVHSNINKYNIYTVISVNMRYVNAILLVTLVNYSKLKWFNVLMDGFY